MRKEEKKISESESQREPNVRLQASSIHFCKLPPHLPPGYNIEKTFMIPAPGDKSERNESRPVSGRQQWMDWMSWGSGTATPPEMAFRPRSPPLRADHPPSLSPSLGSSIFWPVFAPVESPPRETRLGLHAPNADLSPSSWDADLERRVEFVPSPLVRPLGPWIPPSPSGRRQCPKRFDGETFRPPFSRSTSPWASSR